jgi:hypothetical protein
MNAEQFAYWVQGKFEDRNVGDISHEEALKIMKSIKEHVATVFKKVTPSDRIEIEQRPTREADISDLTRGDFPEKDSTPAEYRWPFDYDRPGHWFRSQSPLSC